MRRHTIWVSLLAAILMAGPAVTESMAASRIRGHSVRGSSARHGHHHGGYYRGRTHISVGFGYGYYGYYGYYPGIAYYGYPYAWYAPPAYAGVYRSPVAYIDTDVSPEDAAVFIDGDYVGIADSFDGFPRYLALEPGRHTVTFKFDGYRTWTRTLKAPAGVITKLRIEMTVGEGTDEGDPGEPADDTSWVDPEEREGDIDLAPGDADDPGFVRLSVSPPGATVYLDGEFYAPASTLDRLHGDLRLESGIHVIEVVMPGYETSTRRIELAPGDRMSLSIELRKAQR